MAQERKERTRTIRRLAIPAMVICLVGAAACGRQPDGGRPVAKRSATTQPFAHVPVHPDVPGRTEPCPREGGLEKSGYPCEPILARQAEEAQKAADGQQITGAGKGGETRKDGAQNAGEGPSAGGKK